jgi:hypothetical protein
MGSAIMVSAIMGSAIMGSAIMGSAIMGSAIMGSAWRATVAGNVTSFARSAMTCGQNNTDYMKSVLQ